jgi:transposase
MQDGENGLSVEFRELLFTLYEQVVHWDEQIAGFDHKIEHISQQNKLCIILMTIPGIGPKVATALVAAVGDAREFNSGRGLPT